MSELLTALNAMSPLAVIALLAIVIYQLVLQGKGQRKIATNHLHGLPEMASSLERIEGLLEKIEERLGDVHDNTLYIRARINGR